MSQNGHLSKSDWIRAAVERYEAPLVRYAASIAHDLDRARDAVQDTFLRLCATEPSRVEGHLAEWLFTVCRNRVIDSCRKEARLQPLDEMSVAEVQSKDPSPADVLERQEAANEAATALRSLSANQQEVVRLKFQHGLSYQEISRITGLSVTNVGFLLHTAIKKLRNKLRTESDLPANAYET